METVADGKGGNRPPSATRKHTAERDLLRELAHQIRTPLTTVLGYSELLSRAEQGAIDHATMVDQARTIHMAAVQALRICERVLEEAVGGYRRPVRTAVDFKALAENLVKSFARQAAAKGISLSGGIPAGFPTLSTDPAMLGELLGNLLSNAIKFTPRGGQVRLHGEVDIVNRAAILVVSDTGSGIPVKAVHDLMQGRRVTESAAGTEGEKGWGRGLGIAQELAERLGTSLAIERVAGGGTIVAIRQPLADRKS